MATQLCQKCKQAHPGRVCDYNEKGECAETVGINEIIETDNERSKGRGRCRSVTMNPLICSKQRARRAEEQQMRTGND